MESPKKGTWVEVPQVGVANDPVDTECCRQCMQQRQLHVLLVEVLYNHCVRPFPAQRMDKGMRLSEHGGA